MLSITIDDEAEQYLTAILIHENTTDTELVHRLLHQHWQTIQPQKTVLERMGDRPRHFLAGQTNLSDRDVRKKQIAEYLGNRHVRRQNQEP